MRACHQPWGFDQRSLSSTSSHTKPAKSTLLLWSQMGWSGPWGWLDNQGGGSESVPKREELPTGVITVLTWCYLTTCGEGEPCYSFACPRNATATLPLAPAPEAPKASVSPLCDRYVSPLLTLVSVGKVAWDSAQGSSGNFSRNWNQVANVCDSQLGITIPICWCLHLESSTRWSARKSNTLVI